MNRTLGRLLNALTILLGAFLLFAVEPLIAKMILPWFGGSAGVWIVCLLFFQAALLAGYTYAYASDRWLPARRQWILHVLLLAASLAFLPIIPSVAWKPTDSAAPLLRILALLTATIGLPFLLLAATGPLVQSWLARRESETSLHGVYRLYALSNVGSLAALLAYPVLVEPWLPTRVQAWSWSTAYVVFVLASAAVAWASRNTPKREADTPQASAPVSDRVLWFVLAATPSMLLLAVTNHMLENIAAIPLLWIGPLALYLLSFIICFDRPRWYYRPLWYGVLPFGIAALAISIVWPSVYEGYLPQLAAPAGAFFLCCMVCHGELAARKPASRELTSFYLTVAAGGVTGGLAVAAIAPAVFNEDHDLTIAVLLFIYVVAFVIVRRRPSGLPRLLKVTTIVTAAATSAILVGTLAVALRGYSGVLVNARNFYGPLQVVMRDIAPGVVIDLQNGTIMHGREYADQRRKCEPLTYYAPPSGIGLAIAELGKSGPLHVGVIGLGAGTIAGYARPGDRFRFYEINPYVRNVAMNVFHYLGCATDASVALGDARLTLEREPPNNFDILAVDAFSSDAIPVHLLTREAFDLYWKHIKPGGILAVHVTNTFVDLAPIVAAAAAESGKAAQTVTALMDDERAYSLSIWVLVADDPKFFDRPAFQDAFPIAGTHTVRPWTDDYSNLWQALHKF